MPHTKSTPAFPPCHLRRDQVTSPFPSHLLASSPLRQGMLFEDDVYIVDPGAEILVWVGEGASDRERRAAMLTATKYLMYQRRPLTTPIKVFKTNEAAFQDRRFAQIFAGC